MSCDDAILATEHEDKSDKLPYILEMDKAWKILFCPFEWEARDGCTILQTGQRPQT